MNARMVESILRDGCIIPFNKDLDKISLDNLVLGGPKLEKFPTYILVMVPAGIEYSRPYFSNCEVSTDGFEFGTFDSDFVHEWMPRINNERVGSVTIFGGKRTPYVGSIAQLKAIANSGKWLMNHIYHLSSVIHDGCDGTVSLRYRALPFDSDDACAVERIQYWLRDALCLPVQPWTKINFDLKKVSESTVTYNYTFPRTNIDIKRAFPPIKSDTMKLALNVIWDDAVRRGGYVPRGKYITDNDLEYCKADVLATMDAFKYLKMFKENNMLPGIKKVIFNKPATIVLWEDGTKTIVRTQGKARFDKEKGLAMCIAKKALGNKGNYYDEFRKWME